MVKELKKQIKRPEPDGEFVEVPLGDDPRKNREARVQAPRIRTERSRRIYPLESGRNQLFPSEASSKGNRLVHERIYPLETNAKIKTEK